MDMKILQKFRHLSVNYHFDKTPPILLNLSTSEKEVYDFLLTQDGFRVEQEQLPYDFITKEIKKLL